METLTTHSGHVLHLGVTLTQRLRHTLGGYCQESEVRYAALLEESGTTCADAGDPAFRSALQRHAPRTRSGLALTDLQLDGRLFAQRCSYLIYSEAFRELPVRLKHAILDRLDLALLSRDPTDRYAYLPADERARIREILIETHPDAGARWTKPATSAGGTDAP